MGPTSIVRAVIALTFVVLLPRPAGAVAPVHLWSHQYGGASDQIPTEVTLAPDGNLLLTGRFAGSIDLGGGPLTSAGFVDVFLAKLTPDGNHIWSKRFGDSQSQFAYAVAASSTGDILMVGGFQGTIDFGGGPLTAAGSVEVFVAKFDSNGNHLWSAKFGDGSADQGAVSAAFDTNGNMLVAGFSVGGSIDFGGGPLSTTYMDGWLVQFAQNGAHLWSRRIGDVSTDPADGQYQFITTVRTDPANNVHVTGVFYGTVDFGAGDVTATYQDFFLTRYDANGAYVWNRHVSAGVPNYANPNAMDIDGAGNIVVGGVYVGNPDFGGGALPETGRLFLASFDAGGMHRWSHGFQGTFEANGLGIGVSTDGTIAFTGYFSDSLNVGGDWLVTPGPSFSQEEVFVSKFDANGAHNWSDSFGPRCQGVSNAITEAGDVFVTGWMAGNQPITFGGDFFTPNNTDGFLVRFTDPVTSAVLITRFDASYSDAGVTLSWQLFSDEAIDRMTLLRGTEGNPPAVIAEFSDPRTRSFLDGSVVPEKQYRYELVVYTRDGDVFRSPIVNIAVGAIELALDRNRPNPFNPQTTIPYRVPAAVTPQRVRLRVIGATGDVIRTLVDEEQSGGSRSVVWDGRDAGGRTVASGVYFSVLEVGKEKRVGKMVLLK